MKRRDRRRIQRYYPTLAFLVCDEEIGPLLQAATRRRRWWSRKQPLSAGEFRAAMQNTAWWQAKADDGR